MRQGFTEWAVLTAILLLAATAGALGWGRELRAAFGVPPRPSSAFPAASR